MGWFKNVWGGTLAVVSITALTGTLLVKGCDSVLENNPDGADSPLTAEYYKHNVEQFKEGSTLGIYKAGEGVTPEGAADYAYDNGKETAKKAFRFGEQLIKRLSDDFAYATPVQPNNAPSYAGETEEHKACMRANNNSGPACFGI